MNDNKKIQLGNSQDLQIYHDGTECFLEATGNLIVKDSNHTSAIFDTSAEVQLYYDNAKKLETTSTGISVTGTVTATSVATSANGIRNITTSTSDPTSSDGADGDVWFKYTA